ncbi:MAG: hypothetical protein ABMA14_11215 [Hyphomonadaceae bacterium]
MTERRSRALRWMWRGALLVACYFLFVIVCAPLLSNLLRGLLNIYSVVVFFAGLTLPIGVLMLLAGVFLYVWPERSKP